MNEVGDKEILLESFKEKLVECGWYEAVRMRCREIIASQTMNGGKYPTTDALFAALVDQKEKIPPAIRAELLIALRKSLSLRAVSSTIPTHAPPV